MIISLPFWQVAPAAQAVEVLDMDMIAFFDVLGGDADFFAVFEDQLAQLDVADGNLVPIGNLAVDRERLDKAFLIAQLHLAPIVDAVGKDRCDVVSVVYFQSNSGSIHCHLLLSGYRQHGDAVRDDDDLCIRPLHLVGDGQRFIGGRGGYHIGFADQLVVQIGRD